ncbi:2-hydroxyacyl-CoA dehydratase subunit D [Calderihabitans maritimus]|uniref:2-hydroxyglutaryl-CoA dehydratase subunit D n=1 Tax=Calderihabitans maritimus TaxID=1246530 RepID=A0A1Z5HUG7_9FIRM|nr:2-hydroxyacyl-CoA dehydratase family protein [Calderihabitans maritimus]GAW92971.1 2-hydroxyglutaryl-CoA dehydratase subunit D [Calderihabitans maritimus]
MSAKSIKTDKSKKSLNTAKEVYPLLKAYYQEANRVKKDRSKKVGWVTGAGVVDLTWVFDNVLPVYPENFNASCAAKQITPPLLEISESAGFARDLCGYFRNTYGYMLGGKNLDLPFAGGGMPEPDFLLGDSGACMFHLKWWRQMERFYDYKVPTFILEVPYITPRMTLDQIEEHYLEYTVDQIKRCLNFLEEVTGKKLDEDRLKEVVRLSGEASALFEEVQQLRKNVPSPAASEDMLSCLMPIVQWAGSQEAVDFYRRLRDEVKERVEKGIGVIENERFRLLFDNIPPWYTLGIFNYLHNFDAVSVIETYTQYFHYSRGRMDPAKPYESLARKYLYGVWYMTSLRQKLPHLIIPKALDYQVDGIISFILYGCKISSGFLPYQRKIFEEKYGIPTLILEGDMVDPRDYADAQVKNRIEAFFEMLETRKQARKWV